MAGPSESQDDSGREAWLTVRDAEGNGVGSSIHVNGNPLGAGPYWVTVGGTNAGFVVISHQGTVAYQTFVPINASGAPTDPTDAGAPDGGSIAYPVTMFTSNAGTGHMVSDDLGGTGAVLLEPNGASFLYVKPDGVGRQATGTVISSADGVQANNLHLPGELRGVALRGDQPHHQGDRLGLQPLAN